MQLENGEIECSFLWRPEFSEVNPKLRIAYFEERLIVTKFDDENEYPTKGLTAFAGPVQKPWRKVVRAVSLPASYLICCPFSGCTPST